jgi:hypothetical protein
LAKTTAKSEPYVQPRLHPKATQDTGAWEPPVLRAAVASWAFLHAALWWGQSALWQSLLQKCRFFTALHPEHANISLHGFSTPQTIHTQALTALADFFFSLLPAGAPAAAPAAADMPLLLLLPAVLPVLLAAPDSRSFRASTSRWSCAKAAAAQGD